MCFLSLCLPTTPWFNVCYVCRFMVNFLWWTSGVTVGTCCLVFLFWLFYFAVVLRRLGFCIMSDDLIILDKFWVALLLWKQWTLVTQTSNHVISETLFSTSYFMSSSCNVWQPREKLYRHFSLLPLLINKDSERTSERVNIFFKLGSISDDEN